MSNFFIKYKKNRKLQKINAIELIPVTKVQFTIQEEGKVTLHVKRFWIDGLNNLFNKSEHFNIKLDELGSKTWLLMDGQRNIEHIATKLAENKLPLDETINRVVSFLTDLYRKDFIDFAN
jgi:hypothetical protein